MAQYDPKEVNSEKLNSMKIQILKLESENLKTKGKSNDEVVEEIRKIITREIKKNF